MTTPNIKDDTRFVEEWREWRDGWERFLAQPYGWLSVTSINWAETTPQKYPGVPGKWWQEGTTLFVDPEGGTMSYDGESFTTVRSLELSDAPDDVRITAGDLQVGVTYRQGYLLVTYDPASPARAEFRGVPTYDPDPRWVLQGRFEPHFAARTLSVDTVGAESHTYTSAGVVKFSFDGAEYALVLTDSDFGMYIVFTDATSGVTTYGGCRSLTVPSPGEDGMIELDFNRASNLPCAFNGLPVCPVAPPENRLPFPIEAGEKIPYEASR